MNQPASPFAAPAAAAVRASRLKVLKSPPLSAEEAKLVDFYIAGRRKEQAGKAQAESVKRAVLQLVERRQQLARRGALVTLDHSYKYHYSAGVAVLEKTLSEAREQERDAGTARAIITATVAFEDVRRRDREKLAKAG